MVRRTNWQSTVYGAGNRHTGQQLNQYVSVGRPATTAERVGVTVITGSERLKSGLRGPWNSETGKRQGGGTSCAV